MMNPSDTGAQELVQSHKGTNNRAKTWTQSNSEDHTLYLFIFILFFGHPLAYRILIPQLMIRLTPSSSGSMES